MSRTIFLDVEEAIGREVRRISFQDARTIDKVAFKTTYDPFTGEEIKRPIEPNFYDSSADAGATHYPHFFIRLLRSREDRFSGREIPLHGKYITTTQNFSPKAFEIITQATDGFINSVGNTLTTGILKIALVQPGQLIRLLDGNNKGTYIIDTVIKDALGNHQINVSNVLVNNTLPGFTFDETNRRLVFTTPVDLSTIKVGDVFTDSDTTTFNITAVDAVNGKFEVDGTTTPNTTSGGSISRIGDVFTSTDTTAISFLIMDGSKPIVKYGCPAGSTANVMSDPEVPIDAYYLVRIDSKTKDNHTMILNRMWEEFNPPRTALPVVRRSALSAEAMITADITAGSTTIPIASADSDKFNVGDTLYLFDDLSPSKRSDGEGFERPFEAKIIGKPTSTEIELDTAVPNDFLTSRCAKIVSNADFQMYMFHFVDHVTKDVEGAQYWVHEFTFWVQFWIDRQGEATEVTPITNVSARLEDNEPNVPEDAQIIFDDIDNF